MVRRFAHNTICRLLLSSIAAMSAAGALAANPGSGTHGADGQWRERARAYETLGRHSRQGAWPTLRSIRGNSNVWYIATASSGLWKTLNRGITGSRFPRTADRTHLGCVTLDPIDPEIVG